MHRLSSLAIREDDYPGVPPRDSQDPGPPAYVGAGVSHIRGSLRPPNEEAEGEAAVGRRSWLQEFRYTIRGQPVDRVRVHDASCEEARQVGRGRGEAAAASSVKPYQGSASPSAPCGVAASAGGD